MRLLCFDLDGVIADSTIPITTCINRALRDLDLPTRPPEALVQFIGPPLIQTFESIVAAAGADLKLAARCIDRYHQHYATESLLTTRPYPGVGELLSQLAARDELIVVTSKPAEAALPILDHLNVHHLFAAVHAPALDALAEPKAVTLRRALLDRAADPAATVMVGDRHHDIDAGRECGVQTIGVLWGFGSRSELERAGAHHLAGSPDQLAELLIPTAPAPSHRDSPHRVPGKLSNRLT